MLGAEGIRRLVEGLREHERGQDAPAERYETLGEIARGGMAVVYRARDRRLGRDVALKVVDRTEPELIERFRHEVALAAALAHPNIVPVFDSGEWNKKPFLAMQLIDGPSIDKAGLGPRPALARVSEAARAVHHAHQKGVIHRDLKPSNLLLDRQGQVYVADFGLARRTGSSVSLTLPGIILGTPAYMPPEQARGLEVDERSDVYSLGATLYELLTGRPPYGGPNPGEVTTALLAGPPPRPRRLRPDLSPNAEAIVLKAMEREAGDRYPSAAAFADDIDLYLSGQRPTANPPGRFHSLKRFLKRHPWRSAGMAVSAVLLLLVLGGAGLLAWAWADLDRARGMTDVAARVASLSRWPCRLLPDARELEDRAWTELLEDTERRLQSEDFAAARARVDVIRRLDASRAGPLGERLDRSEKDAKLRSRKKDFDDALRESNPVAAANALAALRGLGAPTSDLERELESLSARLKRERLARALRDGVDAGTIVDVRKAFAEASLAVPQLSTEWRARVFERERDELAVASESGDSARAEAVWSALDAAAWDAAFAEAGLERVAWRHAQALGLARSLAALGETRRAAGLLQEAIAAGAGDPGAVRDLARAAVALRDWDLAGSAVAAMDAPAARADPELSPFWRERADAARSREDWAGALAAIERVLPHSPGADDLLLYAEALLQTGRPADAWLPELRGALLRGPSRAPIGELVDAATRRAALALNLSPFEGREARGRAALGDVEPLLLRLEPKPRALLEIWATLKRRLGEGEAALPLLEKEGMSLERGLILYARGVSADARERFREAGAGVRAKLWRAYAEGSRSSLEEARAAGAAGLVLSLRLAEARTRDKAYEGAIELCLEAPRFTPDDWLASGGEAAGEDPALVERRLRRELLRPEAAARLALRDLEGCAKTCDLALRDGANDPRFRLLRARARLPSLKRGAPREVVDDLEAYLASHPEDSDARMDLGLAFYRLGDFDAAEREYSRVIEARRDWAAAWYSRGRARKALDHAQGALSDFRAARKLPLTPELKDLLDQEPK